MSLRCLVNTVAVLALIMVCPTPTRAQDEMFGVERRVAFELSVRQMYDEQGRPRMVVTTSIPYSRLVFFLKENRYVSSYRVFMELRPEKEGRIRGEVWEEIIQVETYEETQSRSSLSRSKRDFDVEAGEYRIKVTLEVIDTSLRFEQEKKIRIVGREQGELVFSDPVFMQPARAASVRKPSAGVLSITACERMDEQSFIVIPGAVYHGFDVWARVTLSLVGPFAGRDLDVALRIKDVRGNTLLYHHRRVDAGDRNHLQICADLSVDALRLGEYSIEASAAIAGLEGRAEMGGRFLVLFTRSSFTYGFSDTMELLSIMADSDDLKDLESAPPAGRFDAWERFWKKRDPTPNTGENEALDEFFSRLAHVMKHFSRFRPGWQTDRGKIYLEFGKPDKVADYPGQLGRRYQYWYYYSIGTIFVFEDPVGSGEYQLMSTEIM